MFRRKKFVYNIYFMNGKKKTFIASQKTEEEADFTARQAEFEHGWKTYIRKERA